MVQSIKTTADAVLSEAVNSTPCAPGVVAVATNRNANTYEGAFGVRQAGANTPMTKDSIFAIFSTTKAITGTACLQLVEDGKLNLDAPAKTYAPEIGKLQVLDGFDDAGKPKLRAPKRDVTTRMLLLHTAGFGYDFFNETYWSKSNTRYQQGARTPRASPICRQVRLGFIPQPYPARRRWFERPCSRRLQWQADYLRRRRRPQELHPAGRCDVQAPHM